MIGMAQHSAIWDEAVAVGGCLCLRNDDYIFPSHRGLTHGIAKRMSLRELMAEQLARETGVCKGRAGLHYVDIRNGVLGVTGLVGAQ